ncbi:MAG: hypothetical protein PVH37_20145, partial [Desulfobacterales bacterium]
MITKSYKCNEYRYLLTLIVFGLVFFGVQERFCEIDAAGLTRINILPNVQVNSENILLGKIARIESHDSLLAQKLSNIKVAKAPLPGRARTLEYQVFILRLKQ